MTPVDAVVAALEARDLTVRGNNTRGWTAQCPSHDDRQASLSIGSGDDGRALLCCHAGCETETIVGALGLALSDLFPENGVPVVRPSKASPAPLPSEAQVREWQAQLADNPGLLARVLKLRGWTAEALAALAVGRDGPRLTFPIRDRDGQLTNVCRYSPAPDGGTPKMLSCRDRPRDLLPRPEALAGETAWIVEGEPDAVAATTLGLAATGVPGTAFADRLDPSRFTRFPRVNVLLDCDAQGREAAAKIGSALSRAGVETFVLDLDPERSDGHDVGDLVRDAAQDGPEGLAALRRTLERMASEASPVQPAVVTGPARTSASGTVASWPARLGEAAYHGLAGELVKTIEPHTEADPAAILVSLLAAYGNVIGRGAGWKVGGTFHASNLYLLLVGPTSSGRKGTAGDEALRVFQMVDPEWVQTRVVNGLSSGEGLVWQVRDPITKRRKAKKDETPNLPDGWIEEIDDPGESDKRLFVVEAEFAQATKVMAREGNTLSPTLRRLWDRGDARSMVKSSPGRTTGALVSIAGHISAEELRRQLGDTEIANGFANRFMIVCSRRSKKLPFGGDLREDELRRFAPHLRDAIEHGRRCRELDMDEGAKAIWPTMYRELDEEHFGILGSVLRRAVPIVRRLAVIYALLDRQPIVRGEHLSAAAAVWRYCEESARFVFGDTLGYRMADKLRQALRERRGAWLSREDIRKAAGSNNIAAEEIDTALAVLLDHGLAERKLEPSTGGRRPELWRSAEAWEEWEESPPTQPQAWEEWEESPSDEGYTPLSSHSSHRGARENGNGDESVATAEEEALLERAERLIGGEA